MGSPSLGHLSWRSKKGDQPAGLPPAIKQMGAKSAPYKTDIYETAKPNNQRALRHMVEPIRRITPRKPTLRELNLLNMLDDDEIVKAVRE